MIKIRHMISRKQGQTVRRSKAMDTQGKRDANIHENLHKILHNDEI